MTSIDTRFTKEKQFLLIDTPFSIGSAMTSAGDSGFLGIGGERISANEKTLYADVAKALGSSSTLA